jgi:hypothetical protein
MGVLSALFAVGCGDGSQGPAGVDDGGPDGTHGFTDRCASPNEGCACDVDQDVVDCGTVQRRSGNTTWCTTGTRTCSDGKWGACVGDIVKEIHVDRSLTSSKALGNSTACGSGNECDPFCQRVDDDGTNLDLPNGLVETNNGGITLTTQAPGPGGGPAVSTCTGIEISPALSTLTVTGLTPLVVSPAMASQFTVDVVPPGCAEGALTATWTVDKRERAAINGQGVATLFDPIGGDITVTAYAGAFSDTATLRVKVDVLDTNAAPGGAQAAFAVAPTQNDIATVLYPYQDTVFPLGLVAPVIQWAHNGAPANNVSSGAPYTGVTATASSIEGGGTPAANAVDGNLTSRWSSQFSDPQWLRLDLGSAKPISRLRILWENSYSTNYQLHVSNDGSTWTLLKSVANSDGGYDDHVFAPVTARYVRILGTSRQTAYGHSIYEAWVYPAGASSDAVKVSLRYPSDGSVFNWSGLFSESTPPRVTVPEAAWNAFEASAKGNNAAYVVQRAINGTPRREIVRPIRFGTAPLRGKIYYTEYGAGAQLMVADPGSTRISNSVYTPTSETGGYKCPVCHTVSANGNLLANSDQFWSSNGGLSRINTDGTVNFLTPYVPNGSPYNDEAGSQFRGFGWGALTPDGTYSLTASRMTGNAWDDPVGITPIGNTPAVRTVTLPNNFMLGNGNGTGLLAKYFMNTGRTGWEWRREDPRVDFNWGAGAPGGPVPTAFSAIWSGQLQPYSSETYTFTVATTGGVRLTVNGTAIINSLGNNSALTNLTGTAALIKGVKVPIQLEYTDPNASAEVHLYWQSSKVPFTLIPQTQLYPNDGTHGLVVSYFNNNTFTTPASVASRLEPDANANWAGGEPLGVATGDFSSNWTGRIQAPASGNLTLCAQIEANDRVRIRLNNVDVYNGLGSAGSGSTATVCQATATAVTAGTMYPLDIWHADYGGNAKLVLTWQMAGTTTFAAETVPTARLYPATGYAAPTNGLTTTYYDNVDFNQTIATGASTSAFTRIESSANLDFGNNRPGWGKLTSSDTFSWTMTGQLQASCTGMHEFTIEGNDGDDKRRMWLNGVRIVNRWASSNTGDTGGGTGAAYLTAGQRYDIKVDGTENTGSARVVLRWKPPAAPFGTGAGCTGTLAAIPSSAFYPTGDTDVAGFGTRDGGDNGTNKPYFIWKTPITNGYATDYSTSATAGTAVTPGRWGLGTASMMVPAFSPDSTKLVYVNGDSANGGGWRKGLSTFAFDQTGKTFTNRRLILDTWPSGNVIKWPTFESDSRSVIYQAGHPTELCCDQGRSDSYGHMGPSNYFEDTGRAFSIDSEAVTPNAVELTNLNRGESVPALRRPLDANKVYQPTMLPKAAAGYRWAVFTTTRPYGNTLNQTNQNDYTNVDSYSPMLSTNNIQSMLWVSAIDDTPSAGTDRSHPAFFLPNQRFKRDEVNEQRYVNERGFWVKEACRPIGTGAANTCEVDEDCCGGGDSPATAKCILDTPVASPVTRHCAAAPAPNVCNDVCVTDADCCSPAVCANGSCQLPPPLPPPPPAVFVTANFERVYESACQSGQKASWSFLDFKASVPTGGAELQFFAESSDNPSTFKTLDVAPASADLNGVVYLGSELPPGDPNGWSQLDVGAAFAAEGEVMRKYLKITVRLVPTSDGEAAPVLYNWRQVYSCPPSE